MTQRRFLHLLAPAILVGGLVAGSPVALAAEDAVAIPPPAVDAKAGAGSQKLVVAGGCFWGVQGVFQHVKGVTSAVSGYAGGSASTANYSAVSSGSTGHAESVEITYDPSVISAGQLMQVFFSVAHDPTQLDRQGPDHGTQYRSEIFTSGADQAKLAKDYVAQLDGAKVYGGKIVTKIEPLRAFYPAEAYHQDYLTLHPRQPYIVFNDLPKIENLKRLFPDLYRAEPKLVTANRS